MKIIGRLTETPGPVYGDLIVTMARSEWELWRTLCGPAPDGDVLLTQEVADAFEAYQHALSVGAAALGKQLVPLAQSPPGPDPVT